MKPKSTPFVRRSRRLAGKAPSDAAENAPSRTAHLHDTDHVPLAEISEQRLQPVAPRDNNASVGSQHTRTLPKGSFSRAPNMAEQPPVAEAASAAAVSSPAAALQAGVANAVDMGDAPSNSVRPMPLTLDGVNHPPRLGENRGRSPQERFIANQHTMFQNMETE